MAFPPPPYADCVCGTFKVGEARVGSWWAYPPQAKLGLSTYAVKIVISQPDVVPQDNLGFRAYVPSVRIDCALQVPQAKLGFAATLPGLKIDSTIHLSDEARLGFRVDSPDYVGVMHLVPYEECLELDLEPVACL
jgi:hypothetical protein